MQAHIITVGDEILIGQIVDTNSAWMAQQLNLQGIYVTERKAIADQHQAIIEAIHDSLQRTDLVLMTGGLGPTKDDITKKAIADAFGLELVFHEETYQRIVKIFERFGKPINESHRIQSFMPQGCTVLNNKMGTAPGMWFERGKKVLVSMPGVPYEMEYLMTNEVLPRLKATFKTQAIVHRTILTADQGESYLADSLAQFEESLPANIKLAYLPNLSEVRLRLSAFGAENQSEESLHEYLNEYASKMEKIIEPFVFGYEKQTMEQVLGEILKSQNKMLVLAESCTGGLISHKITSVAGSSAYFKGAVVAYSNELKMNLLGVQANTLEMHGAVSEATVIEMAQGALKMLGADVAVSVSGIAGPDGGTPEKPVGTIWIAVADQHRTQTLCLQLAKDRSKNIAYTTSKALNMLRKFLLHK